MLIGLRKDWCEIIVNKPDTKRYYEINDIVSALLSMNEESLIHAIQIGDDDYIKDLLLLILN